MAEFTEVMRQQRRMCKAHARCEGCPVRWIENPNRCVCFDLAFENPAMFEQRVMKWAAEHPEPVYPTWEEWGEAWKQKFPEAESTPCISLFKTADCCDSCEQCRKRPIPADIAEVLGIKPIKGGAGK